MLLLCLIAAAHVCVFSAAFPFFGTVDEPSHFDLVVKYSQGQVPRKLERMSEEATPYVVVYSTFEYLWPSNNFPTEKFPPPWTQPMEQIAPTLLSREAAWNKSTNSESSSPPLYYALLGGWWRLGQACGFHDAFLLYGMRFFNAFVVALLVWTGHRAARLVFPENRFVRLGVPALLAFFPQTAFYSIQSDVLSPLCFGWAFICLVRWWRADVPGARLGAVTGLALAATFLTKLSNLPLLAVAAVFIALKTRRLAAAKKLSAALPSLLVLAVVAGLPAGLWMAWCQHNFGDVFGAEAKIAFLGWTHKPFAEWWTHPLFTPRGLWTFVSELLATFWQGEMLWHRVPLTLPWVGVAYTALTVFFLAVAVVAIKRPSGGAPESQRPELAFSFCLVAATVIFLGFLSIRYDFHDCFNPSRDHPYFTSGRLLLGALIPFLLLFLYGMDRALIRFQNNWVRPLALGGMILFMVISEIITDWKIFPNAYNWFHM